MKSKKVVSGGLKFIYIIKFVFLYKFGKRKEKKGIKNIFFFL